MGLGDGKPKKSKGDEKKPKKSKKDGKRSH
jgi:hypothetical protein